MLYCCYPCTFVKLAMRNKDIYGYIPSLRKMELSFVIWIIVLGSGYIAFPVAKVFLTVFNKLIEQIISAKKYDINWRRFQGNTWRLPNFKKRLNLYSFYGNVMKKSVVTRMSLRSDKDVDVSFKKPVKWQWKNELL